MIESVTGDVYLCASGPEPTDVLNLIFEKLGSPSAGVDLAPIIRIHNKRTLEPILSHAATFLAYLEDGGRRFL